MSEADLSYSQAHRDEFAALLDKSLGENQLREGQVVTGRIAQIENDFAIVDIGLKTEGRIPLSEFGGPGNRGNVNVGDEVEVYVERIENILGEAVLSCDKAKREGAWHELEKAFLDKRNVEGAISARVKGGFTVDLGGAQAFLPGSQIDVRSSTDSQALIDQLQEFQILKIDRKRNNIVVSHRAVMEENRSKARDKMLDNLSEGQTVEGVIKNITEYGAFVDLGGVDGLLHVTEISWRRITDPNEVLKTGDKIAVKVIRINHETQRVNLSMRHLETDPWETISTKYKVGEKVKGVITKTMEYGAFVEIEPGIEGLVHVSEMSWTKKNTQPNKIVEIEQEIEAIILEVDIAKRRISLGMKQCQNNPWETYLEAHSVGDKIKGVIKNITDFGLFIGLTDELDGMVHISDLSWDEKGEEAVKQYKIGDEVEASLLSVDAETGRIALGIKQISAGDISKLHEAKKKGDIITCIVLEAKDSGLDVEIADFGVRGFIRRADLSQDRNEQQPERFAVGQKVDVKITQLDFKANKIALSIRALEADQEKEALKQYGSAKSGASLGDMFASVLPAAFGKRKKVEELDESGAEESEEKKPEE